MSSDALAELTCLREQEEQAAAVMEEHRRQPVMLQALPANLNHEA